MTTRTTSCIALAGLLVIPGTSVASVQDGLSEEVVVSGGAVYWGRTERRAYTDELVLAVESGSESTTIGLPVASRPQPVWDVAGSHAFVLTNFPISGQPHFVLSRVSVDAVRSFNRRMASPTERHTLAGPASEKLGMIDVGVSPLNNLEMFGDSRAEFTYSFVSADPDQVLLFIRAGTTLTVWSYSFRADNARDERFCGDPLLPGNAWQRLAAVAVSFAGEFKAALRARRGTVVLLLSNTCYEMELPLNWRPNVLLNSLPSPGKSRRGEVTNEAERQLVVKKLMEPETRTALRQIRSVAGHAMLIDNKDRGAVALVDGSGELTVFGGKSMSMQRRTVWLPDGRPDLRAVWELLQKQQ